MTNLLEETLQILKDNDKTSSDVQWIGNEKIYLISWKQFEGISNIEYDQGYGASEIATDLIVVGADFYMTRGEYDGSEWWDFHTMPPRPEKTKPFTKIKGGMWEYLEELNK